MLVTVLKRISWYFFLRPPFGETAIKLLCFWWCPPPFLIRVTIYIAVQYTAAIAKCIWNLIFSLFSISADIPHISWREGWTGNINNLSTLSHTQNFLYFHPHKSASLFSNYSPSKVIWLACFPPLQSKNPKIPNITLSPTRPAYPECPRQPNHHYRRYE